MVKFSEKFGLEQDRFKLAAGIGKFDITRIELKKSKLEYESADGKKLIDIVHFDVQMKADGSIKKYYSPNGPIVQSCKEILAEIGTKDKIGTLKEPVYIEEVKESGQKGREYLHFV